MSSAADLSSSPRSASSMRLRVCEDGVRRSGGRGGVRLTEEARDRGGCCFGVMGSGREVVAVGGSRGACMNDLVSEDSCEPEPSIEVRALAASTSCLVVSDLG